MKLPRDFSTEACALGASLIRTGSGFSVPEPLFTKIEDLIEIRDISKSQTVDGVLRLVRRFSPLRPVMLNVQAAYSVLSAVTEPSRLYRWLICNNNEVRAALSSITSGLAEYIAMAFDCGAKVVSISDPSARVETIGEARYREYAAEYQAGLLRLLEGIPRGVVHVCPHCSLMLGKHGYIAAYRETFDRKPYRDVLLEAASGFVIVGHKCVHSEYVEEFYRIEII
jgi:uroporphyrinogen-III decarboxylase